MIFTPRTKTFPVAVGVAAIGVGVPCAEMGQVVLEVLGCRASTHLKLVSISAVGMISHCRLAVRVVGRSVTVGRRSLTKAEIPAPSSRGQVRDPETDQLHTCASRSVQAS